ncbi:MAG: hypothetical protein KC417_01640, partial [Myxococcales bacterium]|nr:hypothetical protein [Myxococcales bacterium]
VRALAQAEIEGVSGSFSKLLARMERGENPGDVLRGAKTALERGNGSRPLTQLVGVLASDGPNLDARLRTMVESALVLEEERRRIQGRRVRTLIGTLTSASMFVFVLPLEAFFRARLGAHMPFPEVPPMPVFAAVVCGTLGIAAYAAARRT